MAAEAAAEAERLKRAMRDEEMAQARFEGIPYKEWKPIDVQRKQAARLAAEEHADGERTVAARTAATKEAAVFVASFQLPFRRVDVFKELVKFDDPLDYPSASFHHTCRLRAGRSYEPHNSSGSGVYDTTRQATAFVPGLVRTTEKRWALQRERPMTLELVETRHPDRVRWKIVEQATDDCFVPL